MTGRASAALIEENNNITSLAASHRLKFLSTCPLILSTTRLARIGWITRSNLIEESDVRAIEVRAKQFGVRRKKVNVVSLVEFGSAGEIMQYK